MPPQVDLRRRGRLDDLVRREVLVAERHLDGERAALADDAAHEGPATVQLGELAHQGQPDPRALVGA